MSSFPLLAAPRALPTDWESRPDFGLAVAEVETDGLLAAAYKGNLAGVRAALDGGARPFARRAGNGWTALHFASAADITPAYKRVGEEGYTPAHDNGQTEVIRFLLKVPGVDANAIDDRGNSPLHLAARKGLLARVVALLPRSDPTARDADGLTPRAALEALSARGSRADSSGDFARITDLLAVAEREFSDLAERKIIVSPVARAMAALAPIPWADLEDTGAEVGKGNFGIVRRYLYHGAPVAVKELSAGAQAILSDPGQFKKFMGEAALQKGLDHPYIVRVLGVAVDSAAGRHGLVMDLCEGSLEARIATLLPRARLEAARQVAAGLTFMHSRVPPIVHADIKPGNILFKPGGREVALADFGFATAKAGISQSQSAGGGKGHGTPGFMAPELFALNPKNGKNLHATSCATDVYAFGVLCFCLATGRVHPYPATDMDDEVVYVAGRVPLGLRPTDASLWPGGTAPVLPDAPSPLIEIAEACWAQEACERPDMATVLARLAALVDGTSAAASAASARSAAAATELAVAGVTPARAVALLREFAGDLRVGIAAARSLAAAADPGEGEQRLVYTPARRACVEAGAPEALVMLARSEAAKHNAEAVRWVATAVRNIARATEGGVACAAAGAAPALAGLACLPATKTNMDAARLTAQALGNIAASKVAGKEVCEAAAAALVSFLDLVTAAAGTGASRGGVELALAVTEALLNIAILSDAGSAACVASSAPAALVNLVRQPAVAADADAASSIALTLFVLTRRDDPDRDTSIATSARNACVAAGARSALETLAAQPAVMANKDALKNIARARESVQ